LLIASGEGNKKRLDVKKKTDHQNARRRLCVLRRKTDVVTEAVIEAVVGIGTMMGAGIVSALAVVVVTLMIGAVGVHVAPEMKISTATN